MSTHLEFVLGQRIQHHVHTATLCLFTNVQFKLLSIMRIGEVVSWQLWETLLQQFALVVAADLEQK